MADSTQDSQSSLDSTHDLLNEWNIAGESASGADALSDVAGNGLPISSSAGSVEADTRQWRQGASIDYLAGFALDVSAVDEMVPDEILATVDHKRPAAPSAAEERPSGGSNESVPRPREGLPRSISIRSRRGSG